MRDIRSIIRRILLSVFLLALIVGTGAFYFVLHDRAVLQAEEQARTLLAAALAVRGYTTEHILPKLSHLASDSFLEETVPSFAAQTVFRSLTGQSKGYTYHEPALNPTSPADRASAFEIDLIRQFREPRKMVAEGQRSRRPCAVFCCRFLLALIVDTGVWRGTALDWYSTPPQCCRCLDLPSSPACLGRRRDVGHSPRIVGGAAD